MKPSTQLLADLLDEASRRRRLSHDESDALSQLVGRGVKPRQRQPERETA